jgi:cell wall-associated NlpC family hydrolase
MPKPPKNPDLAGYLRRKGSPLADHVPDIIRAGNRYRVDPRLIVAIAGGETSFATNGRGPRVHNAWGIGPGRSYKSWGEGIDSVAKLLRESYIGKGLTSIEAIQRKWAPVGAGNDPSNLNSNWTRVNGQFYSDLGGDPMNVNRGWRQEAAPAKLGPVPPKVGATPIAEYQSQQDLGVQQALSNLRSISRGEDPSKTLQALVDASIQQTITNAAAARTFDQPPKPEKDRSPDGGKYSYTRTGEAAPTSKVQQAVELALKQIGKPYVWGTAGPKSFDCSGLIEWAYEKAGIETPGRVTTWSMAKLGKSVKGSPMLPGDWVLTNKGKHVVMYIGGGEVIAAPRSGTNVQIQKLADHRKGIVDVRRYP